MVARSHPSPHIFAALADETRLALVDRLQLQRTRSTTQLAEGTGISRQAVRKHLGVLHEAGLVTHRRVGRERMWELDAAPLAEVRDWIDAVRQHWESRLDRLDAFLLATHAAETAQRAAQPPPPGDSEPPNDD